MKDALELFASRFAPPSLKEGGAVAISSLTGAADAFLALALTKGSRLVLAATPGLPDADRLADDLHTLSATIPSARNIRVLEFPPPLSGDVGALGTRLKTLAALRAWPLSPYPCVLVVSSPALSSPVPTGAPPVISLGTDPVKFGDICEKLASFGYNRVPRGEQVGDFSVRGGIVDAWSPGEEFPIRAEFFGDDLESIRTFDAATQMSIERIDKAALLPAGSKDEEQDKQCSLLDLLPDGSAVLALEHNDYSLPVPPPSRSLAFVYTGDPAPRGVPTGKFQTTPLPGFAELGADEAHHPELFDAARGRLERHLAAAKKRGDLVLAIDDLSGGFELAPSTKTAGEKALLIVAKSDRVFAKRKTYLRNAALARGARLNDFDELDPGEYVVHVDYGVGRFIGSSEILVNGKRSEVFTIEYADGAKLHVPAAHAHLLSRYVGVKGEAVRLHRLDGKRWAKDKADAQKAVTDLAAALLETQAQRELVPGFAYDVECDGIDAFEAAFPYEETPDQAAAIAAVKKDLAAQKPMDRLICGDAGYGKTEVAMRAAFIAAMNGKQTAVLAPTTVLAEQHFETFTSRFDGTPIRIESVSRFQSGATHKGTFQRLATGACDIVIGTHAILSSKIAFRDLGLIIIDEEQRFGVRHKEFLKHLRATADVLTLSATPIPRTLYLSMTGARDLSLIRTPPRERVAVETKVVRDSAATVRAAVGAELARGGQVFFLHNRVSTIGKAEKRLNETCPEARVVVAHGQMDARTLARKMRDFERGKFDVLLSTTIVESGIDIPRANTIIVDHAEMFGLADLYQLRGRVGRSSREGHAYFLLPAEGLVDSDARERLSALQRHGALGSGFNLAVRDLELRGAGNLLGSQQSGHIAAVGFGLYCQLLQRTIAMMKGEKVQDIVEVKLHLDFIDYSPASEDDASAAALPYSYVEEDVQRMSFMKRFAEAADEKVVVALASELRDRFGPLPPAAKRLVALAKLRVACAAAKISNIDAKDRRAVFYKVGSRDVAFVRDLKGKTPDRKIAELISFASRQDGGSPS
ncbi:MAG: transcription-repair coupling factor [Kiritimatiellae bacterium]|nr:transcription-repair coupling factor [Kiritimatiellia bacterium]